MPLLLVVDMQPNFETSNREWLLENVEREIRAARAAGWGIMFLEYARRVNGCGVPVAHRTHARLIRLVEDYPHAITVHKNSDDGSVDAMCAAEDDWWDDDCAPHLDGGIRVVGVNTDACVAATVNGLSERNSELEITVVGDACNGHGSATDKPSNDHHHKIVTEGRNVRVLAVA